MGQQQPLAELSHPVFPTERLCESGPRETMKGRPGLWEHTAWRLFTVLTTNPMGGRKDGGSTDSLLREGVMEGFPDVPFEVILQSSRRGQQAEKRGKGVLHRDNAEAWRNDCVLGKW